LLSRIDVIYDCGAAAVASDEVRGFVVDPVYRGGEEARLLAAKRLEERRVRGRRRGPQLDEAVGRTGKKLSARAVVRKAPDGVSVT
jgi:hypothetical protein